MPRATSTLSPTIVLPSDLALALRLRARACATETCGLLLGEVEREDAGADVDSSRPTIRVVAAPEAANLSPRPTDRFEIDPAAIVLADVAARSGAPSIVGFWHTHPRGAATPSSADVSEAWSGYPFAIATRESLAVWLVTNGRCERLAAVER